MIYKKIHVIGALCAFVPYLPVAGVYSAMEGGGAPAFCKGLGILLAAKLMFMMIEILGSTLAWRLHGQRQLVARCVECLTLNNLPTREYAQDDLCHYLARLSDEQYDEGIRRAAADINQARLLMDNAGFLAGRRYEAAWKSALEIYHLKQR